MKWPPSCLAARWASLIPVPLSHSPCSTRAEHSCSHSSCMSTQQSPAGGGSGQTPTRLGSLLNGPTSSPGDRLGALRPAAGLSVSAHGIAGVGSRLGPAMASLGVDTAAAVAGGAHAHASARQSFAPRVPAERPRNRVASGQPVNGGAPTSVAPQFAALLERTQLDSARLDARLAGHRSPVSAPAPTGVQHRGKSAQGAGAPDAVPQKRASTAARPPAHTASRQPRGGVKDDHAAAGPVPASARAVDVALPAPAGEAPAKRQARRPGAKDRGGPSGPPAPRARAAAATAGLHPIGSDSEDSSNDGLDDVMDVDDDGAAAAGGMPSWADPAREYPITLPFPEPEAVDLAEMAERQDGQLFLMQLPVRTHAALHVYRL